MDLQTGKFTVPKTGKYFFSLSGLGYFPPPSSMRVYLSKNGGTIAKGYCDSQSGGQYVPFSLQSTLQLQVGDQIWVEIGTLTPGAALHGNFYTDFVGWLLQEDVSLSMNVI